MNQTLDVIRSAIKQQRHLRFGYHGCERMVLPMALGVARKGDWQLRGQQVGGQSNSGRVGDRAPKLFAVDAICEPIVLDTAFDIPTEYVRGDSAFSSIDAEL
jgi:hypothetical protein